MILAVVLSLVTSVFYGISDFAAAVGARRLGVLPGTAVTYSFAFIGVCAAVPVMGGAWSADVYFWGALAGLSAIVGFVMFYAALAAGPISLAAPLIAVIGSLVPVAVAVALGELLPPLAWAAVVVALVGGGLISVTRGEVVQRIQPKTIVLGIIAGVGLGFSIVFLDLAPDSAGVIPAVVEIAVGLVLLALLLAVRRVSLPARRVLAGLDEEHVMESLPTRRRALLASAGAGILLGIANAVLIAALHSGSLAVVSVLVGLYPIATIVLARVIHGERLQPLQVLGVALAIAASVLLSIS